MSNRRVVGNSDVALAVLAAGLAERPRLKPMQQMEIREPAHYSEPKVVHKDAIEQGKYTGRYMAPEDPDYLKMKDGSIRRRVPKIRSKKARRRAARRKG